MKTAISKFQNEINTQMNGYPNRQYHQERAEEPSTDQIGSFPSLIDKYDHQAQPLSRFDATQQKHTFKLRVQGFTPGALLNILIIDKKGLSVIKVTKARIEHISRSDFSEMVKEFLNKFDIKYDLTFKLVNNTLYVIPDHKDTRICLIPLNPTNGAIRGREGFRYKISAYNNPGFFVVKNPHFKANSKLKLFNAKANKQVSYEAINLTFGELSRGQFVANIKLEYPFDSLLSKYSFKSEKIIRRLPEDIQEYFEYSDEFSYHVFNYSQKENGCYLLVAANNQLIFVALYNAAARKVLKTRCFRVLKLFRRRLITFLRQNSALEDRSDNKELKLNSFAYSPRTQTLFFKVDMSASVKLVSLPDLFGCPSSHMAIRDLEKNSSETIIKMIEGGPESDSNHIMLIQKFKHFRFKFGDKETDRICLLDPETLEVNEDLTEFFLQSEDLLVENIRSELLTEISLETFLINLGEKFAILNLK